MTLPVRVHADIADDLHWASSYYRENAPEQVSRLFRLYNDAVDNRIPQMPYAYAELFKHYRHIYLLPFKYYVAYRVTDEIIDILAVRHGAEDPKRVEDELAHRTFD